jgi:hypothetical protein
MTAVTTTCHICNKGPLSRYRDYKWKRGNVVLSRAARGSVMTDPLPSDEVLQRWHDLDTAFIGSIRTSRSYAELQVVARVE